MGYIPSWESLICKPNKASFLIWDILYLIMKYPKSVTVFFLILHFYKREGQVICEHLKKKSKIKIEKF